MGVGLAVLHTISGSVVMLVFPVHMPATSKKRREVALTVALTVGWQTLILAYSSLLELALQSETHT